MITPVTVKGRPYLALGLPHINSHEDFKDLRDSLLEVIDLCLSDEESKEVISGYSMHILLRTVVELNKDLED